MPRRRPRAQSRGDHRHRTAWTTDDRHQVEELMVRWRHNVPALEWERLAMRLGRTAAALRAWVWRNRLPRWRRHPWTELQLRRIRAQWKIGGAAGWSDRKIARAAAPTLAPHSVGSVYMQAYRLGLHGQPRPDDHEKSPRGPPGSAPPPSPPDGVPVDHLRGRQGRSLDMHFINFNYYTHNTSHGCSVLNFHYER